MDNADSDAVLVSLAQQGDRRAFEALVVKYQRRIARHVARYITRSADVEDVVQETFVRAYRGLPAFRGQSAFYTWIYRIASNVAMTTLKRQGLYVSLDEPGDEENDTPFEPGRSDEEDPERTLVARQINEAVQQAMARLKPEFATPLLLFEVEGKTYAQIAEMLGVSLSTVKMRIFRAREFVAQRLKPVLEPQRPRNW
jgi:RNA polymerase sigma-70 factor (ECF subfamily)